MERYFKFALVALGLLLIQTVFIPLLSLRGFIPDILVIWVVYVALRRGQMEAMVIGFLVGLLQDFTTTQFFGLAALSQTVCGFVGGYFFNENKTEQTLGSYRFVLIVLLCSMIHNIIYFMIFFQGSELPVFGTTLQFGFLTTLYTGLLSLLPMFAFSKKYLTA